MGGEAIGRGEILTHVNIHCARELRRVLGARSVGWRDHLYLLLVAANAALLAALAAVLVEMGAALRPGMDTA